MKYYCLPADFKTETIDAYDRLSQAFPDAAVLETYGNITIGNDLESGRPADILPPIDLNQLRSYIEYSAKKGIDFNYTINASYMENREFSKEGIARLNRFMKKLYEAGVRLLTVTLPSVIEVLSLLDFEFRLTGSTIYQVTNVNKATELQRMGVDRLVVDESINRNFKVLKRIRETFGEKVEVIVNSICHKDCSYRMFHYNQIAGESIDAGGGFSKTYYPHKCLLRRYENPGNFLKLTWIRPEDIKFYTQIGINYFKIQGRPRVLQGDPVRAVEAYFKEDYQGDLFQLLNLFAPVSNFSVPVDNKKLDGYIEHFQKHPDFCRSDCIACGFCENFGKKSADPEKIREVYNMAREYYSGVEPLKMTVKDVLRDQEEQQNKVMADDTMIDDGDFDL